MDINATAETIIFGFDASNAPLNLGVQRTENLVLVVDMNNGAIVSSFAILPEQIVISGWETTIKCYSDISAAMACSEINEAIANYFDSM